MIENLSVSAGRDGTLRLWRYTPGLLRLLDSEAKDLGAAGAAFFLVPERWQPKRNINPKP